MPQDTLPDGHKEINIEITRGDTRRFVIRVKTGGDIPAPDYDELVCTVRESALRGARAVLRKSLTAGGVRKLEAGVYLLTLLPEDTQDLTAGRPYVYDLERRVGADIFTPIKGYFKVTHDVTRPGDADG